MRDAWLTVQVCCRQEFPVRDFQLLEQFWVAPVVVAVIQPFRREILHRTKQQLASQRKLSLQLAMVERFREQSRQRY